MALKVADRIKQTTTTSGTGDISFTGTPAGFATFGSVLTNGDTTYYAIEENDKWEVGIGTYGSDNMVRTYVLASSNSGSAINLGGSGVVFITYPADKSVYRDGESQVVIGSSGVLFSNGTIVKDAKLPELTDVASSGAFTSTHVLSFNNTNKSLLLGDSTGPSKSNNTIIGYGAASGTTGTDNVVIGTNALVAADGGIENIGVGTLAGPSEPDFSSNASYCVSVGHKAGSRMRSNSTAIGHQAGIASYEFGFVAVGSAAGSGIGGYSVAVGYQAGNAMASDYVVSVGHQAGKSAAGESSVWVGNMAGNSATSASKSIGIGYQAGKSSSADDSIYIGQSAGQSNSDNDYLYIGNGSPSSSRTLIKGDMQSKRLAVGAADVTLSDTLYVGVASSVDTGLVVRGAASQTANLTEWQDLAGTNLAHMASSGILVANGLQASGQGLTLETSVPTNTSNTLWNAAGTLYWGTNTVGVPTGVAGKVSYYNLEGSLTSDPDFAFDSGNTSLTVGSVTINSDLININEAGGKTIVGRYTGDTGITDSNYSLMLGYAAGLSASGSNNSVIVGNYTAFNTLNTNNSQMIGNLAGIYSSGERNTYVGDSAGAYSSGTYNTFIGNNAGKYCVGSQNVELVASGSSNSVLDGYSNKLNIGDTIIGDTSNKKLAVGNVGASNVTPDATLEILPKNSNDIGVIVQGAASQSANLQEWQASNAVSVAQLSADGSIATSGTISASGGVLLAPLVPATTTNKLYNDAGTLKFNGSTIGGDSVNAYVSGIAAYSSGVVTGGNMYVGEYIYHDGDTNTYIRLRGDQFDFVAGGRTMLTLDEAGSDTVTVNDGANDVDFQVKGENDTNLIRTDAANDLVGIGTSSPSYKLDVFGHDAWMQASGIIVGNSGVVLANNTPTVTTNTLYNDGGTLSWNGSSVGGGASTADLNHVSGIAVYASGSVAYASGQAIENETAIATNTSNVSTNTSNISTNTGRVNYASGQAVQNEIDIAYTSGIATYASGNTIVNDALVAYASGNTIVNDGLIAYASGNTANITFGSDVEGDILYHNGTSFTRLAKGSNNHVLTMNGNVPNWEASSGGGGISQSDFDYASGVANYASGQAIENESDLVYASGSAAYASGQAIENETDLVYASGSAAYASGQAIENEGLATYASGQAIENETAIATNTSNISTNTSNISTNSGRVTYASGQAIENETDILYVSGVANYASGQAVDNETDLAYVSGAAAYSSGNTIVNDGLIAYASGNTANITFGSDVEGDILYHNGTTFVRLAKGTDDYILKMNGNVPNWEAESGGSTDAYTSGVAAYSSGVLIGGIPNFNVVGINTTTPEYGIDVKGGGASGVIQATGVKLGASGVVFSDGTTQTVAGAPATVDLTAGDGLTGGGTIASNRSFAVGAGTLIDVQADQVDVDLSEAAAATIAHGDHLIFLDGGATGAASKGSTDDLANLLAGDGLTKSNSVMAVNVDDSTIETNSDAIRVKDDGITLAKMAGLARGKIIYGDTNGDPAALALGGANQVLTSDGTDAAWADNVNTYLSGVAAYSSGVLTGGIPNFNVVGINTATPEYGIDVTGGGPSGVIQATGIKLGASGVVFSDGTTQTVAGAPATVDLTAGDGLTGGGTIASNRSFAVGAGTLIDVQADQVDVDLSEASEAAIANGDYIIFLDGGATGTAAKEAVHDLATLFAGAGLTATNSVIAVDAAQGNITSLGTLTTLTVDSIVINGTTIGHTSVTDAITIDADGGVVLSKAMIGAVGSGALSGSDTDLTVDWATGNYHEVTLNTANIDAVIFHNVTVGQRIVLRIQNDNASARSITWTVTSGTGTSPSSATVSWAGGTAPTMTAAVDKADTYGFICRSATTFDGFVIGQNI